jgi:hypothetical protein
MVYGVFKMISGDSKCSTKITEPDTKFYFEFFNTVTRSV